MISHIDTTVLVAALVSAEPRHEDCAGLLNGLRLGIYSHGLSETFNTLTGGRLGFRLPAGVVAQQLTTIIAPLLDVVSLTTDELLSAFVDAESRGVRGGAIFDYLHLVAARKAGADRLYTLNLRHFLAFRVSGDPEIVLP
jgi:predicted nucleic acid-binding protein